MLVGQSVGALLIWLNGNPKSSLENETQSSPYYPQLWLSEHDLRPSEVFETKHLQSQISFIKSTKIFLAILSLLFQ